MLILAFSFLMFIWQASEAIANLMNPSAVDSTEGLSIEEIDPLLITICPLDQWNETLLNEFGYVDKSWLLQGLSSE